MTLFNRLGFGRGNRGNGQQTGMAPGGNGGRGMGGGGGQGMGGGGRGQGGGGRGMGGGGRGMGGGGRGMGGGGQGVGGGCRGMGGSGRGMGRGRGMGQGMGQGVGQGMGQGQGMPRTSAPIPAPNRSVKRVAVSCNGKTLNDAVEPRFGRAAGFLVVDIDTMNADFLDNSASQSMAQGAGIQAAENVANAGAEAVLTGRVGPKATDALNAANVFIAEDFADMTVREAVEKFAANL